MLAQEVSRLFKLYFTISTLVSLVSNGISDSNQECMFPDFLDGLDVTCVTQFFFDVSAETGLNHLSDLQHQYLTD